MRQLRWGIMRVEGASGRAIGDIVRGESEDGGGWMGGATGEWENSGATRTRRVGWEPLTMLVLAWSTGAATTTR